MKETNYKEILEYLVHEVTQINANIKSHSEILSKGINDKNGVLHHSDIIHENSTILSALIDIAIFNLNPNHFTAPGKDLRNIHGKFKKCWLSFRRRLKHKNIKFELLSDVKSLINLFPVIDTLPYLLLDNAIKYSHKDGHISVNIADQNSYIIIEVENSGPKIFEDEKAHLFEKHFRGINAQEINTIGSGLGLYFIKHICDIHNATIQINYGVNSYILNEMEYSTFKITIQIPRK